MRENRALDQADIRRSNMRAVLQTLRERQPISRKELVKLTQMSPTSITRIINALLDLSLIVESHVDESVRRGRKSIQLTTNPKGLYVLGFLVNSPRLEMCVMDFNGRVPHQARRTLPRMKYSPEQIAKAAMELYQGLRVPAIGARLSGIGVSIPGIVNQASGVVTESHQLDWNDEDIRGPFERAFGLPAWIENDVKAALIGEKQILGLSPQTDTAYLFLGSSGIATAVTSNGELVRGERNAAGEVSHIALIPSDIPCGCGQHGCLQMHLVAHYLLSRAKKIEPAIQSMQSVVTAYRQRLSWAEVLISDFKRHLLLVIALLDSFCNPSKIILCGGIIGELGDILSDILSDGHLIVSPNYAGASVQGAAMIAMRHALSAELIERVNWGVACDENE